MVMDTSRNSRPLGYPSDESASSSTVHNANMVSNARSYSYSRYGNDVSTQDIGWDHGEFSPKENSHYMIRWKSGKRVDQRLLMLLESLFQDLYMKRHEFFKKIFPENYNDFVNVFKKIGTMLSKNNNQTKHHTMQRSLSLGSPGSSKTKLEWFNVKTPNVTVAEPPGGQIGNTGTTAATASTKAPK